MSVGASVVRLGLIGCGAIGRYHASRFPRLNGLRLVAAADPNPDRLADAVHAGGDQDVRTFADGHALIHAAADGWCDAVLIATPHPDHPTLTTLALRKNLHVLCEKPVAITALAAERVNAVARERPHLVFAIMYNQRGWPIWRRVKALLDAGELGPVRRVNWVVTDWFRTQAYYDAVAWRGTWAGEGGGVLINQCPHNLDLLQWLVGMPARVVAYTAFGRHHDVDVEDDVTAFLQWPATDDGPAATGVFVTNSGEYPGTNRLEIVGDRGTLTTEGRSLITLARNHEPVPHVLRTSPDASTSPTIAGERVTIKVEPVRKGHEVLVQNFVNAILHDEPLIAPGVVGIAGLELGNAILASGLLGRPVDLPTDRVAFAKLLDDLQTGRRRTRSGGRA